MAEKQTKNPCWEGFVMRGTKTKMGKKVPNCIPASKGKKK